jgi:hypothetical protein
MKSLLKNALLTLSMVVLTGALCAQAQACNGDIKTVEGNVLNWLEWGQRYGINGPFLVLQVPDGYIGMYLHPQYANVGREIRVTGCVSHGSPYENIDYFSDISDVQKLR